MPADLRKILRAEFLLVEILDKRISSKKRNETIRKAVNLIRDATSEKMGV